MALIKIANLTLLLLAGSTDAFAKPRARVARGGASSSKARDALLLNWLLANSSLSADGSTGAGARPARHVWPDAAVDRLQPRALGRPAPVVGQGDVVLSQVRPRAKRFRCVRSAAKYMDLHQGVYDAQEALTSTLIH